MSVAFAGLTIVDEAHKKSRRRDKHRLCKVFDDALYDVLPPRMIGYFCIGLQKGLFLVGYNLCVL